MSLWKKEEYSLVKDPNTNENIEFSGVISGNTTVITSEVSVDFAELFSVGDVIRVTVNSQPEFLTVTSVESEELTTIVSSAAFTGTVYKLNVPKWIKDPSLKGVVSYVDYAEATSEAFREVGLKTPGWVTSFTYEDQNGNTRNKNENLVVVKGQVSSGQ